MKSIVLGVCVVLSIHTSLVALPLDVATVVHILAVSVVGFTAEKIRAVILPPKKVKKIVSSVLKPDFADFNIWCFEKFDSTKGTLSDLNEKEASSEINTKNFCNIAMLSVIYRWRQAEKRGNNEEGELKKEMQKKYDDLLLLYNQGQCDDTFRLPIQHLKDPLGRFLRLVRNSEISDDTLSTLVGDLSCEQFKTVYRIYESEMEGQPSFPGRKAVSFGSEFENAKAHLLIQKGQVDSQPFAAVVFSMLTDEILRWGLSRGADCFTHIHRGFPLVQILQPKFNSFVQQLFPSLPYRVENRCGKWVINKLGFLVTFLSGIRLLARPVRPNQKESKTCIGGNINHFGNVLAMTTMSFATSILLNSLITTQRCAQI